MQFGSSNLPSTMKLDCLLMNTEVTSGFGICFEVNNELI